MPRTGGAGWGYEKFTRRENDWAIVAAAAVDGRVALANMGRHRCGRRATEEALARGASIAEAAALADQGTRRRGHARRRRLPPAPRPAAHPPRPGDRRRPS